MSPSVALSFLTAASSPRQRAVSGDFCIHFACTTVALTISSFSFSRAAGHCVCGGGTGVCAMAEVTHRRLSAAITRRPTILLLLSECFLCDADGTTYCCAVCDASTRR